jgi:hypothetical protein
LRRIKNLEKKKRRMNGEQVSDDEYDDDLEDKMKLT